jgi:hypothetical protein
MGILVRSGPLSHPDIHRLIDDHFVPVALDILQYEAAWGDIEKTIGDTPGGSETWIDGVDSAEVERFRNIVRQASMAQGIWLTTPDGTVLRSYYGLNPRSVLATMNAAIQDWQAAASSPSLPVPVQNLAESEGAKGKAHTMRLNFIGRLVDGTTGVLFRDFAMMDAQGWTSWLGKREVGDVVQVPQPIVQSIASRLFPGEMRLIVRTQEVQHAMATVTVREIANGIVRGEWSGSVTVDGTFPFSTRRRLHRAELSGELYWRVEPVEVVSMWLVSDGQWQGEYPGGRLSAAADIYPGGTRNAPLAMSSPMRLLFLVEL